MNQEPDDVPFNPQTAERGFDPASSPALPRPLKQGQPPRYPSQAPPPYPSPQDERLARLRALREQRQRTGTGPIPPEEFKRRGLPAPPPEQPPLPELLKHWWQHGPLGGLPPGYKKTADAEAASGKTKRDEPPVPHLPTPYEERAKELLAQGRKSLSLATARAKDMMNQAKDLLNQKVQSQPKLPSAEAFVPGLIVVRFVPTISRERAVKEIAALGGKPLRHKAAGNLFQVAVPPGQEQALIQRLLQQPDVISADVERARPAR
jgi:hypothetical protein